MSLATRIFPTQFKHAVVTPFLKKGSPDSSQLKSYQLASNLPFFIFIYLFSGEVDTIAAAALSRDE